MKKVKRVLALALVGALVFVGGCSSGEAQKASGGSQPASKAETLRIGAVYPFTGGAALLGDESFRGAELAVKLRNQKGGVAGGKTIELSKADSPDANAAQSQANRLISQENIQLIVGSYSSSISMAASEVAERNGVVYWEMGAISDPITDRGYKYVFRVNPTSSQFARSEIDYIKEVVPAKLGKNLSDIKIAIAHEDSLYGTTVAGFIEKLGKEDNLNVVSNQAYNMNSLDLSSVVLNLKKAQPDVLIAVSYLNDAILLTRQSKELGFDVPVFIGNGGGHTMTDFQKALGADANGILNTDFPQYEIKKSFTPGLDEFIKLYKDTYGTAPRSGHSLANFMGMNVLLNIIDKVGSIDPNKIQEAAKNYKLESGKSETGWGVEFSDKGQNKLGRAYVTQWLDGKLVTVWPKEAALQESKLPLLKWSQR